MYGSITPNFGCEILKNLVSPTLLSTPAVHLLFYLHAYTTFINLETPAIGERRDLARTRPTCLLDR